MTREIMRALYSDQTSPHGRCFGHALSAGHIRAFWQIMVVKMFRRYTSANFLMLACERLTSPVPTMITITLATSTLGHSKLLAASEDALISSCHVYLRDALYFGTCHMQFGPWLGPSCSDSFFRLKCPTE